MSAIEVGSTDGEVNGAELLAEIQFDHLACKIKNFWFSTTTRFVILSN